MASEVNWKVGLFWLLIIGLCFLAVPVRRTPVEGDVKSQFDEYLQTHQKTYSADEYQTRLKYFEESVKRAEKRNKDSEHLGASDKAHYGVTKFSDMSPDEFKKKYLTRPLSLISIPRPAFNATDHPILRLGATDNFPDKLDWRDVGVVTAVKDQGACGACWAFSVVECIESMDAIKGRSLKKLSVQQVIDCARNGNMGCQGGNTCTAVQWMVNSDVPIRLESNYPLTLVDGTCPSAKPSDGVQVESNYTCNSFVNQENQIIAMLNTLGPLSIAVDGTSWQDYLGGVIQFNCETNLNHAAQIVGYDRTTKPGYYIVRNSWGRAFGIDGYLHIKIGSNLCGTYGLRFTVGPQMRTNCNGGCGAVGRLSQEVTVFCYERRTFFLKVCDMEGGDCSRGAFSMNHSLNDCDTQRLLRSQHIKFFQRILGVNPSSVCFMDVQRALVLFFSVSGLDLLGALDSALDPDRKQELISWIYSLQILPNDDYVDAGGFRGSSTYGTSAIVRDAEDHPLGRFPAHNLDEDNLAMVYVALTTLVILGDDLKRVNRPAIINCIKRYRLPDGSFFGGPNGGDNDMRFVYCACCVCVLINDWSAMEPEKTKEFILNSLRFDGGIAQSPGNESQGGSTFCGVASLFLMQEFGGLDCADEVRNPDTLHVLTEQQKNRMVLWLLQRHVQNGSQENRGGFCGRPEKDSDTCYTFWISASLQLLGSLDFVRRKDCFDFVLSNQDQFVGGFFKLSGGDPDPLHTYMSLAGLSLLGYPDLSLLNPALNISQRAFRWLQKLHMS
ncbi:unnamed protein product [Notodromas monacha]|uniref:Uncharacterized protein n=1 Tax=Notodromas monacha TaxID=399045 RepID=A0A7R9BUB9_9CRUS|nr:unnamed protein product [Notodromas monacha]CAG0921908.1 unnamed protein product [Notodromas monacha]